jgi:RNA polymerase sigma factor (sigma-70 family)
MEISEANYQEKLFPYAYNILGTVDDALDAVQDVMVKHIQKQEMLVNESAYLIQSVINHSINLKKRQNRIVENGVWLPEPLSTDDADGAVNRQEIISYSMLVLLEYLNPKERAVFILREAFDYSHEEIAGILSFSVENSRKLLSRARNELKRRKGFKRVTMGVQVPAFLKAYVDVIRNGDAPGLKRMLSDEIIVKTDGGTVNIVNPVTQGIEQVMQLMLHVYQKYQKRFSVELSQVNHQPALLYYDNGVLLNCQVFELSDDGSHIDGIYSIVDPLKLKRVQNTSKQ